MGSRQRYQMPVLEIDLNNSWADSNIHSEEAQEAATEELQYQLPDLNCIIEEGFVLDFNLNQSPPTTEISSSQFLFDLNKEPCAEDETEVNLEVIELAEPNLNTGITISFHIIDSYLPLCTSNFLFLFYS